MEYLVQSNLHSTQYKEKVLGIMYKDKLLLKIEVNTHVTQTWLISA